jgi:hypothetical protein
MRSNVSSHCKGDYGAAFGPLGAQVTAKGVDIAFKIDRGEQGCPNCRKVNGLSYIKKDDGTFVFKCDLCKVAQSRN